LHGFVHSGGAFNLSNELPPVWLEAEKGEWLGSGEIIEWLLSLPGKYGRDRGFVDGVNFVSFAFNYDATQVLADLPSWKVKEICQKKDKNGRKLKSGCPTWYKDYAIDYLKGKWLKLWKLRDHNHPRKPELDKFGHAKLKPNGKPKMKIDEVAYINIEDAFGFYQSKFTTATKPLIKQGYMKAQDHKTIEYHYCPVKRTG
jgi:hypothetical protein